MDRQGPIRQAARRVRHGQADLHVLGHGRLPRPGRAVKGGRLGPGCSTWGAGQAADLCTATDPGERTAAYTYTASNSDPADDYDLSSATAPGATATDATDDAYNAAGDISQTTDPAGNITTYAYSGANASYAGGSTTISATLGAGGTADVSVDTFSSDVLIQQQQAAGTANASTVYYVIDTNSLLPDWSTDGDGNVTTYDYQNYGASGGGPTTSDNQLDSIDALGNETQAAYNADNQEWCSVDAADYANGARCPAAAPSTPPAPGGSYAYPGVAISFYNSADELTARTDALGNTTTYSYTVSADGVPAHLEYCSVDPVDYQQGVTCPAYGAAHVAGTTTETFDAAGDTLSTTTADGDTTSYTYGVANLPGAVKTETDPDGTITSYAYDPAGQPTATTVSYGSYTATTLDAYDAQGREYCQVEPREVAAGVTCPAAPPASPPTPGNDLYLGATITTYDADGQVAQTTNPLGGVTYDAYDQAGNRYCEVDPDQAAVGVICPAAPPASPPTPGDDPYLGATITTYDTAEQAVQVTNPLGGITLDAYNAAGDITQTTVESDDTAQAPDVVTDNDYNADDELDSSTVDPDSGLAETTLDYYDPDGNVYCAVSANAYAAGSTAFQCPAWQPGWITRPPAAGSLYSADPGPAQAEDVTTTFYNADGQQVQTTNPDGDTTVTALDGDGRAYCAADPTNVAAWLAANPSGDYPYDCPATPPGSPPAAGSDPGYTTTIYDPAGQTVSTTDPDGDTTRYTYTPGGQTLTTTNPSGDLTTNCYYYQAGSGGCAAGAPSAGGSADDLYATTTPPTKADPAGETTTYTYYPGDTVDTTTTPAGTTTDTYDPNGDLAATSYTATAAGYAKPANVSYTYNADGSQASVTDATGTTTDGYDANGDLTSQTLAATGNLADTTVGYTYDTTGILASTVYPAYAGHANPTVTYAYDATGTMTSETDWLGDEVTFGHDADGNETSQDNNVSAANPTGTSSTTFAYDAADNNTAATSTLAQTCGGDETLTQALSGPGGSQNPDGLLTENTDTYTGSCSNQATQTRYYNYDPASRLVYQGATAQGASPDNFAYDPPATPPPSPPTTPPATSTPTPKPSTTPAKTPPRHPSPGPAA